MIMDACQLVEEAPERRDGKVNFAFVVETLRSPPYNWRLGATALREKLRAWYDQFHERNRDRHLRTQAKRVGSAASQAPLQHSL